QSAQVREKPWGTDTAVLHPVAGPGHAGLSGGGARGLGPCRAEDVAAVGFGSWFGFIHLFTAEEVEDLGRQISRKVIWEADQRSGYPHVSFEPVP
ncbi:MAG: hypothetical protein Q8S13_01105, partial [Dehalococcoidia bacterium]|nr:hypothetical protein [Dehalococcoidia bacterium]